MCKTLMAVLIAGGALALPLPATAATAKSKQLQVARPTYDQCYSLALRRGITVGRGDRWIRERFIRDCMIGKIPF